jgi:hypothetical protein
VGRVRASRPAHTCRLPDFDAYRNPGSTVRLLITEGAAADPR